MDDFMMVKLERFGSTLGVSEGERGIKWAAGLVHPH